MKPNSSFLFIRNIFDSITWTRTHGYSQQQKLLPDKLGSPISIFLFKLSCISQSLCKLDGFLGEKQSDLCKFEYCPSWHNFHIKIKQFHNMYLSYYLQIWNMYQVLYHLILKMHISFQLCKFLLTYFTWYINISFTNCTSKICFLNRELSNFHHFVCFYIISIYILCQLWPSAASN